MVPFYPAAPVRAGTLLLSRRPQTGTLSVCRSHFQRRLLPAPVQEWLLGITRGAGEK